VPAAEAYTEAIEKTAAAPLPLVVVLNWTEELKQRAPTR
jgi:hypothetical protein